MKHKSLSRAQNKIDYIVYHNPDQVAKLLYDQGFEPPKNPKNLAAAIRELSRKKGRKFLKELIKLHPDKQVILSLDKQTEDSHCGACNNNTYDKKGNYCKSCGHSNYIGLGDEDSFLGQFESYTTPDLEKYYQDILRKSNQNPEDKNLAKEVQMIWNQIRQRKNTTRTDKEHALTEKNIRIGIGRDELILLGIVFFAGALVGHGLKFNNE